MPINPLWYNDVMINSKRTDIYAGAQSQYDIYRKNDPHLADEALKKLHEIDENRVRNSSMWNMPEYGMVHAVRFDLPHVFPQRYGILWKEEMDAEKSTYTAYVFFIGPMP